MHHGSLHLRLPANLGHRNTKSCRHHGKCLWKRISEGTALQSTPRTGIRKDALQATHGVCVFYLASASFYLGTSCVRCPLTQYPTNNQPPSHLNIYIKNRRMRTFYGAILCACMVGRCLCCIVALFHYRGANGSRQSSRNDGKTC